MKINNFNRVVSQAQQVLANVQATFNSQGVKAAKEAYKIQMQMTQEWFCCCLQGQWIGFPLLCAKHQGWGGIRGSPEVKIIQIRQWRQGLWNKNNDGT